MVKTGGMSGLDIKYSGIQERKRKRLQIQQDTIAREENCVQLYRKRSRAVETELSNANDGSTMNSLDSDFQVMRTSKRQMF